MGIWDAERGTIQWIFRHHDFQAEDLLHKRLIEDVVRATLSVHVAVCERDPNALLLPSLTSC